MAPSLKLPVEELPLWMRQARRGVDWGILLAFVLSLYAALPFLVQPSLPRTNASERYAFLVHDYADALSEGRLYPRWSAHALQGYGAPIPHYFPPGAPYSAALIEVLFTNDTLTAVRMAYLLGFLLAGMMTYAFVMRTVSASAGITACALYLFSPYVGHVAPYILGDLAEVIALGLLPALLWGVHRLITVYARFDFTVVALLFAGMILVSPTHALIGAVISAGLLVSTRRRHNSLRLWSLALGSGACLAIFFWLPALAEHDAVNWIAAEMPSRIPPLSLAGLLRPMERIDLNELLPPPQFTLGLPLLCSVILSLSLGLVRALPGRGRPLLRLRGAARTGAFFLGTGSILLVLSVRFFPNEQWLLGIITFTLAVGAASILMPGLSAPTLRYGSQSLLVPLALLLIFSGALPVWMSPQWPGAFGSLNNQEQLIYEQSGFGIAVLPPGFPAPVTLELPVETDRALALGYQSGNISRLRLDQSQPGRRASVIESRTHSDRFQIRTVTPTLFQISRAYFPGWQARFEALLLPLFSHPQTGLVQIQVPTNVEGDLTVSLGTTPIRRLSWVLSWVILMLIILETLRRLRKITDPVYEDLTLLSIGEARLTALIIASLGGVLFGFGLPSSPYSLHARPGYALDNTVAVQSRTEAGLELISAETSTTHITPGGTLEVMLAWRTSRPLRENYQVQLQLFDRDQNARWLITATAPIGGYPTRRWQPYRFVRDRHVLHLPNIAPGAYVLGVEVIACSPVSVCHPEDYLSFFGADGQAIGRTLILPILLTSG